MPRHRSPICRGAGVQGPRPVLRVLRRQHRPRLRCEPPIGVDRAGGQHHGACRDGTLGSRQPRLTMTEWLETDGLGGFAMGTNDWIRTRRYHSLLLAATAPPEGRMVLVADLEV